VPDRFHYAIRELLEPQIHLVLYLDGFIDEKLLARAIQLTVAIEPVLGCQFMVRSWRPYWEMRNDLNDIIFSSLINTGDIQQELHNFMKVPLDPCHDPQLHVRIIRSHSNDTLCIKMNHMLTDGTGLVEYAYLLTTTYQELIKNPQYKPARNRIYNRNILQVLRQFSLIEIVKSFRHPVFPGPDWGFPWINEEVQERTFNVRTIDREQFQMIKAYGRKHRASLNDIVVAAFYRALFAVIRPEPHTPHTVQTTIDLRRYQKNESNSRVYNFYSALYPRIVYKPDDPFGNTIIDVRDAMNHLKNNHPGLATAVYREIFFIPGFFIARRLVHGVIKGYVKSRKAQPTISNVGSMDHEKLAFSHVSAIDVHIFGPVVRSPGFMVSFASFKEQLTFTIMYYGGRKSAASINSFLDTMKNELERIE
jgi:NRPS condensation-like uncharacterized protein